MASGGRRPHALVIPQPQQGHWNPMLSFIRQLVNLKVSFTVLSTPSRLSELQVLKDKGEFKNVDHVELVEAFTNPEKGKYLRGGAAVQAMKTEFSRHPSIKEKLIADKSSGYGPNFILADMFLYWTQDLADELGIPRYSFFSSPATFVLLALHAPSLIAEGWDPKLLDRAKLKQGVGEKYLGLEQFHVEDIPEVTYQERDIFMLHAKYIVKAAGVVINSFSPFEEQVANDLRTQLERVVGDAKVPSVFLIGPILSQSSNPIVLSSKEPPSDIYNSGCFSFLDSQSEHSVLYICFGSQTDLEQSSISELAKGLELSEVSFLWVLHRPAGALPSWDVSQVLPAGFGSRTKGRGLMWTGWAPQTEVLNHPSVGGFLTHCGWNSLVESIQGGVPLITWPLRAEQKLNRRFMVKSAKVGLEIEENPQGEYVAEKIADAISLLMNSDKGKDLRLNMEAVKGAAAAAVGEGGSSQQALHAFVNEVGFLPQ